jgi:uncharacterized membrane protein
MEQAAYPVNSGTNPQSTTYRITSIDLLRGLVMIIMALDHARDYFHGDAMLHDPLNLQTTTPVLFFTRWITHYCAPVFVFLSGISAYISGQRKNKNELGNFLMRRGLWLIFIEITVVTFGWTFNPFFSAMVLQVIWAIGISMIALGLFCRLPYQWIAVIALLIVCGHNLLDIPEATHSGKFNPLWTALHIGGFQSYALTEGHRFFIAYPVLPWIGIMMLGFVFGKLFTRETDPRQRKKTPLTGRHGHDPVICYPATDQCLWRPDTMAHANGTPLHIPFLSGCQQIPTLTYVYVYDHRSCAYLPGVDRTYKKPTFRYHQRFRQGAFLLLHPSYLPDTPPDHHFVFCHRV